MLNNPQDVTLNLTGRSITIQTGVMAKQANGSVTLKVGNLVLLATATMSKSPKEGIDFFPLTVEYVEKMYASGKIPGGFFKREARPATSATLTARLIDRPIRPTFPSGMFNDVQVVVTVISYDDDIAPEPYAIMAASAAIHVSDIPFNAPVSAALVGRIDGKFVVNPTQTQLESSDLHLVVAGTQEAILMIEAGANELPEAVILEAIQVGHNFIKESLPLQETLRAKAGKEKQAAPVSETNEALKSQILSILGTQIEDNMQSANKQDIESFLRNLEDTVISQLVNEEGDNASEVKALYNKLKKEQIRKTIITKKVRPDGRQTNEVRAIEVETGLLPSTHGSALFTRGETQSLGVLTLGTADDEQLLDGIRETTKSKYYFHYNFPPYSVGECGNMARTGRRELGHGALAERALKPVLPVHQDFPYTIRLVSEILESNGSSSMASVCSGALALMDCGVPIKAPVSGIAMGLLMSEDGYVVLSDIQGLEDHYGDMDFKVAGTTNGITALQLDIKIAGLSEDILRNALQQANEGRLHILGEMNKVLEAPRLSISPNAPRIETIMINPEKVGLLIGPGGKMIRRIEEESKASVVVSDTNQGEVSIAAKDGEALNRARNMIVALTRDVEVGDVYEGRVVKIMPFGAFIELVPGKEGLLHVSQIGEGFVKNIEDHMEIGQEVKVQVREIDKQRRVNLAPAA